MDPTIFAAIIGVVGAVLGAAAGAGITYKLTTKPMSDRQIFRVWHIAFDSSVFKGPLRLQYAQIRATKQGIEDIINAVNTGDIRGSAEKGKGRTFLKNKEWFLKMENVASRLDEIRVLADKLEPRIDFPTAAQIAAQAQERNENLDKIDHERDEI